VTPSASLPIPRNLTTVFLDRDGVLNEKMPEGAYVTSPASFRILRVVVVSNQRGIALGLYTVDDVEAIHAAFQQTLSSHGAHIDAFFLCPHDKGQCNCRKPLPGLFEQATAQFPTITAASSVMIGDSLVDIEFARRLGMTAILISNNSDQPTPGIESARRLADLRFSSLHEVVNALVKNR
jgi:D-glycero-D-manno-heptose 1,7-bisphosphate phosphatase